MKIRIVFAAIALFAIASAFTSAKLFNHAYEWKSSFTTAGVAYYEVVNVDQINNIGTGAGEVSCESSLANCMIESDVTPSLVAGKQAIRQDQSQLDQGTFTQN
jgi:hypothetical protein